MVANISRAEATVQEDEARRDRVVLSAVNAAVAPATIVLLIAA